MTRKPVLFLALMALGCGKRLEPPGAALEPSAHGSVTELRADGTVLGVGGNAPPSSSAAISRPVSHANGPAPGSADDNLPFTPDGTRIASVAWRTWIYTDVGKQRTRYGYLRVGALVDARGPAIVNDGCDGGWYRVNPRGFVCLGLGATTDIAHPVVVASQGRPRRGEGLPYTYALSSDTPPLLYFRLPSSAQMKESEGGEFTTRAANFRERIRGSGLLAALGDVGAPPEFLAGDAKLPLPGQPR